MTGGGSSLLFTQVFPDTGFETQLVQPGGGRKPERLRKSKLNEIASPLSPDGRWFWYSSEESGRWEVYVRLGQKPNAFLDLDVNWPLPLRGAK